MSIRVTNVEKSLEIQKQFDHVFGLLTKAEFDAVSKHMDMSNRTMIFCDDVINPKAADAPKKKDIEHILQIFEEFALFSEEKRVLVHCRAGISRSTAVAIGLLINRGWEIPQAFMQINIQRPMMWPNDLILKHFDDIMSLDGELVKFDKEWKKNTGWMLKSLQDKDDETEN